jgi:hypothetical protein
MMRVQNWILLRVALGVCLINPSLQRERRCRQMRGRRLEKTGGATYYTARPKRAKTRSFPREYVEGARCDE